MHLDGLAAVAMGKVLTQKSVSDEEFFAVITHPFVQEHEVCMVIANRCQRIATDAQGQPPHIHSVEVDVKLVGVQVVPKGVDFVRCWFRIEGLRMVVEAIVLKAHQTTPAGKGQGL